MKKLYKNKILFYFDYFCIFVSKLKVMKDKILKLRKEGKSYKSIVAILGCSLSTVSYHCGEGQKGFTVLYFNRIS